MRDQNTTAGTPTPARRGRRRLAGIAAGMALALFGGTAAQACMTQAVPEHTLSLSVRTLQSDLNVAALSCGEREKYNSFVVRYRGDLQTYGSVLKTHFESMHGGAATKQLNTYVTDLFNFAAIRHAENAKKFCGTAASAFTALLQNEERQDIRTIALAHAMQVSPRLQQQIQVASADGGCDVTAQGSAVAENEATAVE
jgi:hypothetical protein